MKNKMKDGKILPVALPAAGFVLAVLLLYAARSFHTVPILELSLAVLGVYWVWYLIGRRKQIPPVMPILFTCLFLPKLNLLKVSGMNTAGVRIDDFLALGLLILAVMKDAESWKNRSIQRGIQILIVLSAVNLLSLASGLLQGYNNQILYSVLFVIRRVEYYAFALVGVYTVRRLKDPYRVFMKEFTLMSLLHIGLAGLQLIGKSTYMVSGVDAADFFRGIAVSTFNGYYEYGQFLCFGCAVFVCDFLKRKSWISFAMLPVTLGMLVLSKSRSSLIAGVLLVVIAVFFPIRDRVSRRRLALGGYGTLGVLAVLVLVAGGIIEFGVVGRFGTVDLEEYALNWKNLIGRGNFTRYLRWERTGIGTFDAMDYAGFLKRITDWSAAARLYKWGSVLDGFRRSPVLGYGMGVTMTMDGNYIKLLVETGIAGTALWLAFYGYFMHIIRKFCRRSALRKALLLMMVSILLNALLIDMFEASKPMEMIWLLVGGVIAFAKGHSSVREEFAEIEVDR